MESSNNEFVTVAELARATDEITHHVHRATQKTHPNGSLQSMIEFKHLISGVMIATIAGVLLASLLLAWCCLAAIARNKFSFIQMNIVRRGVCNHTDQDTGSQSRFRRGMNKIYDSLRCASRHTVGPSTKFNIDNVLKPPPPSYEESKIAQYLTVMHTVPVHDEPAPQILDEEEEEEARCELVENARDQIRIVVDSNCHNQTSDAITHENHNMDHVSEVYVSPTRLMCPRHGHLYRQQQQQNQQQQMHDEQYSTLSAVKIDHRPNHSHHPQHNSEYT